MRSAFTVSQHIWVVFFLCINIPHKSKWIEDTEQVADHNKLLDVDCCSGLCCFGVPVSCMPTAEEFD